LSVIQSHLEYDSHILKFLTEAGSEGLSVAKISRHVFNASNTFFETVDFEEVHRYVASFVLRNSKSAESLLQKTERGIYRLNPHSAETRQLMLQFGEEEEEPASAPHNEDLSLSLFD